MPRWATVTDFQAKVQAAKPKVDRRWPIAVGSTSKASVMRQYIPLEERHTGGLRGHGMHMTVVKAEVWHPEETARLE